ncbi:hypothetical protein Plec18167_007011 [Paecilomyces lecythidis]|uniref:Aminoglycoside phosphotransferase domain-containing protein n=1 Tax=Paecilomyces lecythidis TaxID=3004212 RepID=A0ABR3X874_9EURO
MPIASDALKRYTIGPLTSPELWRSGRASMNLDRGPWRTPLEYAQAVGRNEMAWIESHAAGRMNFYRSLSDHERPKDALSLLSQYLEMTSYVVPQDGRMALWHPDLHLNNVFVDPKTHEILRIVDWQTASVAPLFLQYEAPRMFRHHKTVREGWVIPERPDNFDSLSDEEKAQVDADLENETMHKYYEAQVYKRAPLLWRTLQNKLLSTIREPIWLTSGLWENRDLFFLRRSLLAVATNWEELCRDLDQEDIPPCPIKFTEEELKAHAKEEENIDGVGHILTLFRDQGVLPADGMVDPEDYEKAKENSLKFKDVFVGLGENEEERELYSRLWPYQDQES